MSDYVILIDSSADMTKDLRERFGITDFHPGYIIHPDGHNEEADVDWERISPLEFYDTMSKGTFYKTSQPSLGAQVDFFEKYLSQGYDILNLSLSSALSGTYNTCCIAASELAEKYPERKIICIDSLRYSGALALLCCAAGEMKKAGKSIDEVADWLEENKHKVHQMGTVDDLKFLKHMGRVSNLQAVMGSLINLKPLADFDPVGMNQVIGKVTGYNKSYTAIIEYMKRLIVNPQEQRIVVSCTNRKAQAMHLRDLIEKEFSPKEIIMTQVNMSCSPAIGPGMVVAFFMGDNVTEGLTEETKVMNDILGKN
ncbi:MAG: DegV family protein [Clostridia bacterium]|nr:DegV family protein [Clostridia bacterium]